MPRRASGDRPLTQAERQAHQREKRKQATHAAEVALGHAYRWIEANAGRKHPTELLNEMSDAMGALRRFSGYVR